MTLGRLPAALALVLAVAGCGAHAGSDASASSLTSLTGPTSLGSTFTFTRSPIDTSVIEFVTPLGNLNPPGHTLPTDHIYFYHHLNHRTAPQYDVYVPADGVVSTIQRAGDDQIYIWASSVHMYYVGHVILDAGIAEKQTLTAGQHLGKTSDLSFGLDLGLMNMNLDEAFLTPARYSGNSLHCDAPLKYFTEPLKSQLYATVSGTGANRDGRINFDQRGTLSGNWFHESLAAADSAGPTGWPRHLAFVRHNEDPSRLIVSIGGTVAAAGVYDMAAGAPDPTSITPASGAVTFTITSTQFGGPSGPMTVTMTSETRVRVQFAGGDQIYVR